MLVSAKSKKKLHQLARLGERGIGQTRMLLRIIPAETVTTDLEPFLTNFHEI